MIRASKPAAGKITAQGELESVLAGANAIIMADFTGLPVADFDQLRLSCFKSNLLFIVAKNTIAKLTLEKLGHTGLDQILTGPTGFCIGRGDPVQPIKLLADFIKEKQKAAIKGGLVDGRLYGPAQIEQLRNIPPREVLIAQIVGAIASPLSGFVFVIQEILRSFVSVVDQVAQAAEANPDGRPGLTASGGSVQAIIDAIEKMTVLELVELKKALEDKFGVTAAAPMAFAGAMPGMAGAAAAPAEEVEEQTEFTVMLIGAGEKKIQVIKEVRAITSLGLKEAKDLVDGAPKPVKEGISKEEALKIKAQIEEAGGTVELK
ncbi:MAG: 50S ribosomal protein L7/L12 [Calditrichaeota bacterium]|nr:50S ribosomal protein L7/L12 [Calditrichota bacterium]